MTQHRPYTPLQKDILTLWVTTNRSAQDIANELGVSKNTVCGLSHRFTKRMRAAVRGDLQFMFKDRLLAFDALPPPNPAPRAPRTEKQKVDRAQLRADKRIEHDRAIAAARALALQLEREKRLMCVQEGTSIMELEFGMCRAVTGEHVDRGALYCAEPVKGTQSYCAAHCKQFFIPNTKRRRGDLPIGMLLPRLHVAVN